MGSSRVPPDVAAQNRNDPCDCGSGLKYKRCHLPKEQLAATETARDAAAKRAAERAAPVPKAGPPARDADEDISAWHTPKLPADLSGRVGDAMAVLQRRGVHRRRGLVADIGQGNFEEACHDRWIGLASDDADLIEAREKLLTANGDAFELEYHEGLTERQNALQVPLAVLESAGERGVPHLGILLTEDTWSSILAVELLAKMPSGPLRDRALTEALFLPGDWPSDTSVQHLPAASAEAKWAAFENVVTQATRDNLHLHGLYWVPLFEANHEEPPGPLVPTPDLGRAIELLYDYGHLSALGAGLEARLDPGFVSLDDIRVLFNDPGAQQAFQAMMERKPGTKLMATLAPAE